MPTRDPRTLATRVALSDGAMACAFPWLLLAFDVSEISTHGLAWLTVGSLVLATFVGWRGYRFAVGTLRGTAQWYRLIVEGFVFGAVPVFAWMVGLAASTALAAGTGYEGASSWSAAEWFAYVGSVVQISLVSGALGATLGLALTLINRLLLRAAV